MMSTKAMVVIVVLAILSSALLVCGFILIMTPVCILPPSPPYVSMTHDEDSPDYTLKIISMSETVKISDVEVVVMFKANNSAFSFDLEDILLEFSKDNTNNITYYDKMKDNILSSDDSLILKIDYDGPDLDGNNDGDFINEGPFSDGDIIRLLHKRSGGTMGVYTIDI